MLVYNIIFCYLFIFFFEVSRPISNKKPPPWWQDVYVCLWPLSSKNIRIKKKPVGKCIWNWWKYLKKYVFFFTWYYCNLKLLSSYFLCAENIQILITFHTTIDCWLLNITTETAKGTSRVWPCTKQFPLLIRNVVVLVQRKSCLHQLQQLIHLCT